jgi:metallo-beta-lactamase family protein
MKIIHHGAVDGVTGSCHQLNIDTNNAVLIDCGLFQGAETSGKSHAEHLQIDFSLSSIKALIVTHCHIDHVGRIPYLLAAGFRGPIYATEATASLLPLVIEDALKVGVTRDKRLIDACLKQLQRLIKPIEYRKWTRLPINEKSHRDSVRFKFQPAGHILGSAYVEIESKTTIDRKSSTHRVVFSGDLGAPYTPLLAAPKSPYRADTLVIESTYGDKCHQGRKHRTTKLKQVIERATQDNGVVLIPAFSMGRTQELLYEFEEVIYKYSQTSPLWHNIEIIIDSPMAARFTEQYLAFKELWDNEAKRRNNQRRHPLDFEQIYTVDSHEQHKQTVQYLSERKKPAIVIAASGMCQGGRIENYLKTFLSDKTADVIFVGYQARGTIGRAIQQYGHSGGYVEIDHKRFDINAQVHTISGYSAHADQKDLVNFVKRMRVKPKHIKIVHGDEEAKQALKMEYEKLLPHCKVEIAT